MKNDDYNDFLAKEFVEKKYDLLDLLLKFMIVFVGSIVFFCICFAIYLLIINGQHVSPVAPK